MSNKENRRFAFGALLIGMIGFIVGILTAPKSGKENRKAIKDAAGLVTRELEKDLKLNYTEIQETIKKLENKINVKKDVVQKELSKNLVEAKTIQKKVREALSAIHEGSSSNSELESLLKEVKTVKKHLINYLTEKK